MRKTSLPVLTCAVLTVAMLCAPVVVAAQEIDAAQLIERTKAFMARQDIFSAQAVLEYGVTHSGGTESMTSHVELVFKRPNILSIHLANSEVDITFLSDGKRSITYVPMFNQYRVAALPKDLTAIVKGVGFGPMLPATTLLAEFIKARPFDDAVTSAPVPVYMGEETLDDAKAHHLRLDGKELQWDMWVDAGETPVVRRIEPDMTEIVSQFKKEGMDVSLEVRLTFEKWTFGEAALADLQSGPPAGAMKVVEFGPPADQPPAYQLLGKPAPDFTLSLLDGTQFNLAAKRGNEIIILDFWATWCGPCRVGMPILDRISKAFAEKGVRLYAVNLRETQAEIMTFLQRQSLDITVALDTRGNTGQLYKVDGIPQTVIIGMDGTVQVVHIGVRDLETSITDALNALVDGVNLAETG